MSRLPTLIVPAGFGTVDRCPIVGCTAVPRRTRIMCWRHWLTVPPWLRAKVCRLSVTARGTSVLVAAITDAFRRARQGPPPSLWFLIRQYFRG
jgi:hypothetical protein